MVPSTFLARSQRMILSGALTRSAAVVLSCRLARSRSMVLSLHVARSVKTKVRFYERDPHEPWHKVQEAANQTHAHTTLHANG